MFNFTRKQIGWILITFGIYGLLLGWQVGLLLVVAVGFHEACHLWAAHKMGIKTGGFYLFPFVGGVALVKERYKTRGQQAFVVLAGPIGGGLLAMATGALGAYTGSTHLLAAATWMLYLNLFNLLPLSFLDGGQLLDTLTYTVDRTLGVFCHILSTVVAVVLMFKFFSPVLGVLIALAGGAGAYNEFKNWKYYRRGDTYLCDDSFLNPPKKLTVPQWFATAGVWALTTVVFFVVMHLLRIDPTTSFKLISGH